MTAVGGSSRYADDPVGDPAQADGAPRADGAAEDGTSTPADGATDAGAAVPSDGADLQRARAALLAPRRHRQTAAALRDSLAELYDFWLTTHAAAAGVRGPGVALVAVGGLGRRDVAPYSDLDLLLVHNGRSTGGQQEVGEIAERLWYPIWDSGIGLDHSVRTIGQALDAAKGDLRVALGLLEIRHLAGDDELTGSLVSAVRKAWRSGIRGRLDEITESARQRWHRNGPLTHRVEPDLKNGRGGLRDVQLLRAFAVAQLLDRPGPEIAAHERLLLDVRTELHRGSGRALDVLHAQDGDDVAAALDLGDRFDLARALSGAGRTVAYAVDVAFRAARAAQPRRGIAGLRRSPARRPLDEGVVRHGDEVVLARDANPARDPALLLRVARAAAVQQAPISTGTLTRLAEASPELREPWPRAALGELVGLLGAGDGVIDVIEALDRTGLWGRLFPEWEALRDLPPRDGVHVWTVDRHLVQTVAHAGPLATRVSRPDLLLLGALLHDVGKGRPGDHSVVGAEIAAGIVARLGLPPADAATVVRLVRHHLLLPHTATRRDVQESATVERVAATLGGDRLLLDLAHALAEADARATGPGVWTAWKSALIGDLVAACRGVLRGEPVPEDRGLAPELVAAADRVADNGRPIVLLEREAATAAVTVLAPDGPGVLSAAAGVLALNALEVHDAQVGAHAGVAVDVFTVSPTFGSLPRTDLLGEQFTKALAGTFPLGERLRAREADYGDGNPVELAPPRVLWFTDEAAGVHAEGTAIVEVRAADRLGLLHLLAGALSGCGVDVRWSKVATYGVTVVDSFCVYSPGGFPRDRRRHVEQAILGAVHPA